MDLSAVLSQLEGPVEATADRPSRSAVFVLKDAGLDPASFAEQTLFDTFEASVARFPDEPCVGHRPVDEAGAAGPFEFLSYAETRDKVAAFASALKAAGVQRGDRVAIFGANSVEWMVAMQACNRMAYHCVPLYDTLGENSIQYILNHSESAFVVVADTKLAALTAAVAEISYPLKGIVYWGSNVASSDLDTLKAAGIQPASFESFSAIGSKSASADPPLTTDIATIMYTSGTTGTPKGVVLTHAALRACVQSLSQYLHMNGMTAEPGKAFLSYLPLAHIFDRICEELLILEGGRIGYWQASLPKLMDDIQALKPTLFIGVPRVFERVYKAAQAKVADAGYLKRVLFQWAYGSKLKALAAGAASANAAPLWDRLVFGKMKAALGGSVDVIVSGGAPLPPHVDEYLRVTMCAPVVQGYGLTETCAAALISKPDAHDHMGTVGYPLPVTELCLESVPDMRYDAHAEPPRGQLLLRGAHLFSGYLKDEEKTAEVLRDGWFETGDIAELLPNGTVKIIDRKKNIFKLSQGEYIAVEKLESEFKRASIVNQVWVYGNSFQSSVVAVVVPTEAGAMAFAKEQGLGDTVDFAAVCKNEKMRSHVLSALSQQAKASKMKGFEYVKRVYVESEEFSVANNLMTPTFKLKRPQLQEKYQAEIDVMYASMQK